MRLLLALLVLQPRDDVVARREADDALRRIAGGRRFVVELRDRGARRCRPPARRRSARRRDRRRAARRSAGRSPSRNVCARPTGVSLTATSGSADRGVAHNCSTSQSATILTPALRPARRSARSTAANARDAALAADTPSPAARARAARRDWRARGRPRRSPAARRRAAATPSRADATASCSRSLTPPAPVFVSRSFAPSSRRARIVAAPPPARARAARRSRASTSSPALACERLAEAAVGRRRDGARLGFAAAARHQHRGDVVGRQRPEPQLRTARPHRRQQHVGTRRHQDEHRRRRRLLERLQQRVLRRRHQRVRLVDDHDAAAPFERPVAGAIDRRRGPARS